MDSKVRTVTILLAVCTVINAVFVVAQRSGSSHPPVLITVLTVVAAVLTAAGAFGLRNGDGWSWPVAVGGAALSALLAVGAIINAPGVGKVAAVLLLVLAVVSVVMLKPLRRSATT